MTWTKNSWPAVVLLCGIVATLVYFYGFLHLFVKGTFSSGLSSTAAWAWQAWNPGMNQEHSKLVPFISLGLIWHQRQRIKEALKVGSNHGLIIVAVGILLFILGARCLQPRMSLSAIPLLVYGSVLYLCGREVARIVLFPCAFLIFMIPFAFIEQATFRLQFIITGLVGFLTELIGIKLQAVGTTLTAADGSFNFEIAEGCSGIRSLTAMAMLTAIYAHLTENQLWKKLTLFCFSVIFAILGNAGRIFTVVLVAKLINPQIAAGIYHDYSGYVFFPIAVLAMLGFSKVLNFGWRGQAKLVNSIPPTRTSYDY